MCGKNAACAMANKPRGEVWHFGCWNAGDRGGGDSTSVFSVLHEVNWIQQISGYFMSVMAESW